MTFGTSTLTKLIHGTPHQRVEALLLVMLMFAVGSYLTSVFSPYVWGVLAEHEYLGGATVAVIATLFKFS